MGFRAVCVLGFLSGFTAARADLVGLGFAVARAVFVGPGFAVAFRFASFRTFPLASKTGPNDEEPRQRPRKPRPNHVLKHSELLL